MKPVKKGSFRCASVIYLWIKRTAPNPYLLRIIPRVVIRVLCIYHHMLFNTVHENKVNTSERSSDMAYSVRFGQRLVLSLSDIFKIITARFSVNHCNLARQREANVAPYCANKTTLPNYRIAGWSCSGRSMVVTLKSHAIFRWNSIPPGLSSSAGAEQSWVRFVTQNALWIQE